MSHMCIYCGIRKLSNEDVSAEANRIFKPLEDKFAHQSEIQLTRSFYGPGKRGSKKPNETPIVVMYDKVRNCEGGVTANFTMSAFNEGTIRITIMGTKGTITGDMNENSVTIYSFSDKSKNKMEITSCLTASDLTGGHGGGDEGIMHELKALLDAPKLQTGVSQNSVSGHMVAFAAEHSRITGQVVYVNEYIDGIKNLVDKSEFRV